MDKPQRGRGRGRARLAANDDVPQNVGQYNGHGDRSRHWIGRGRHRDDLPQSQRQKFTNGNGRTHQTDLYPQIPGVQNDGVESIRDRNLLSNSTYNSEEVANDRRSQQKFSEFSSFPKERSQHFHPRNEQTSPTDHFDSEFPSLHNQKPDIGEISVCQNEEQSSESSTSSSTKGVSVNSSSAVSVHERTMPKRPGLGTLGQPIKVKINYFPLTIPTGNVYHYDVKVCNEKNLKRKSDQEIKSPGASICRKVMEALLNAYKEVYQYYPAYDGKKNLITRRELPFSGEKSFRVSLENENKKQEFYVVKIKAVKNENEEHIINLDELHDFLGGKNAKTPFRAIMALDIIMRHVPSLRFTSIGKSLFRPPTQNDLHPLGGGREIWFGYHQSVRPTAWKMMVNIDKAATAFYESQPLLHLVGQILSEDHERIQAFTPNDIRILTKELKGLKIKVTHQTYGRKYRIHRVTTCPLSELAFPIVKNNVTIQKAVVEYFKEQYQYHCKFSHLSGLNVGTKGSPKYLPMEVCNIVEGQHCKKKLSEKQTSEMIKFTVIKPEDRFRELEKTAKQTVEINKAYMKEFGLQMNTKCIEATARVLEPPRVLYDNKKEIEPYEGKWDMKQKRFFAGAVINRWVLISMSNPKYCTLKHIKKFTEMLYRIANSVGIKMPCITAEGIKVLKQSENIVDVLKRSFDSQKFDFAIIVLPNKNASTAYSDIKQIAETQIGLKTQCVRDSNIVDDRKCRDAFVSNLCQKINAKMGGVNCGLGEYEKPEILKKPVIFMGADVTHPSPGDKISVSIAAVVGSLDAHPSRYTASVRVQRSSSDVTARRIEIIQDLKNMVKELLREFYKSTRQKPEKIIFYRDGVSEGEFQKVQDEEVTKIREACTELEAGYQPGITFVVVGKRHHMRMMPVNKGEGVGPAKNVPPGTYVDTVVVHPTDFDFYLCSHFGALGTSRPSHYTVLWDDNDFSANEIEKLSYYLCHVYVRCTRSISIPSPVQYAHLAAARAKQHLISKMEVNGSSDSGSSGEKTVLTESVMNSVNVVKNFNTSMYYV